MATQTPTQRREAARILLQRRQARDQLPKFAEYVWPGYLTPPHLEMLDDVLYRVESGDLTRAIIEMPPRHGKSLKVSQLFPAWALGRQPNRRVILSSYATSLAQSFGRHVRNIVASREYGELFPGVELAADSRAASEWELATPFRGALIAAGIGAGITGRGGDLVVIDDPVKDRQEADSEIVRESVWDWYTSVLRTRLEPGAAIILCMTRWHHDDLAGRLLAAQAEEDADQWEVLTLPAIAEIDDPLGRAEGDPLWPDRYDLDALAGIRADLPARDWAALYQQRPQIEEGQIFPPDGWSRYDATDTPWLKGYTVQAWDTAYGKGKESDNSVCSTWTRHRDGTIYLRSVWVGSPTYPELKAEVQRQYAAWKPDVVWVEDAASGQSVVQDLVHMDIPVRPWKPDRDKIARAHAVTPYIAAGRVKIPEHATWLPAWLDEHAQFPHGKRDDRVDSTTLALDVLTQTGGYNVGGERKASLFATTSGSGKSRWGTWA